MSRFIDSNMAIHRNCSNLTQWCGKAVAWLTLVMAVAVSSIVVFRSVLNMGAIGAQESVTYMHTLVIMLTSAYTLHEGGHVRVDILYQRFSTLTKAWVNALGNIFLLIPVALFIVLVSWDYVVSSWAIQETSADAGGLPGVFLLKTLLIINGALLLIQAVAECAQNLITITVHQTTAKPPEASSSESKGTSDD